MAEIYFGIADEEPPVSLSTIFGGFKSAGLLPGIEEDSETTFWITFEGRESVISASTPEENIAFLTADFSPHDDPSVIESVAGALEKIGYQIADGF